MKQKNKFILTICLLFSITLLPKSAYALELTPLISEYQLSNSDRERSKITITNTENKTITVTPKIYPYDPQTSTLLQENGNTFLKADIETFEIKSGESIDINYEIIPQGNLEKGSYFNLLVLEQVKQDQVIKDTNPVNTTGDISHLVVLHVIEGGSVKGITSNFANTSIEMIDKGIPFLKPMVIKYTFQNITNYVLEPEGEIQIYNINGDYEPTYVTINKDDNKLYPNETKTEEITVNKWHLRDLISERKIIGRFYNGIDENHISTEVIVKPYTKEVALLGIGLILLVIFLKSFSSEKKN